MSSVSHRFTPPTCTLEITGKRSPLSRWTKQDIVQKLQFKLKFDDPREATVNQVTISGTQKDLWQLQEAINLYVRENLQASFQLLDSPSQVLAIAKPMENKPYLESQGLVSHKLYFADLAHDSDKDHIKLSTVQLFDLVTALEGFQTEVATLPETKPEVSVMGKILPLGGGIAAIAIAGVGIATLLLPALRQPQIAESSKTQAPPAAKIPELAEIIPPPTPETSNNQVSQPKLPEQLTSANRLPPPPAVDTPKPKPDIPDPADYPLAEVARQSGLNNSQTTTTVVPSNSPEKDEIARPDRINPEQETELVSPLEPTKPSAASRLSVAEELNQTDTTINSDNSELDVAQGSSAPATEETISSPNSNLALRQAPSSASQLQEVTAYFANQWQPPENLRQSLEYRLLLNPDGSIKKVIPLGKASRLYLSQTKIPVNGEPFVSPPTASQSSTIRLLLNPDGRVQAFTE